MFEKLARFLARWQAKLKHWHGLWNVGAFIGTLARKNEKVARFWHEGMLACKPNWHVSTLGRRPHVHAGTQLHAI